jgi:hypothetical protein
MHIRYEENSEKGQWGNLGLDGKMIARSFTK